MCDQSNELLEILVKESLEAENKLKSRANSQIDSNDLVKDDDEDDKRCENGLENYTVRIFISSTFRDFHNERNVLVTQVFPRLREWCSKHLLHLVECDLRWGIPTNASREETLSLCMEEIEKGRIESNDMNFFLGLLGERYGWVPDTEDLTEFVKTRYGWIPGSSVTLMEFIHGLVRSQTPNALILFRDSEFIQDIPVDCRADFHETNPVLINNLNLFKKFLEDKFTGKGQVNHYKVEYQNIVVDELTRYNQVVLGNFREFEQIIEKHFKYCIEQNLISKMNQKVQDNDVELYHEFMFNSLGKNCIIESETVTKLTERVYSIRQNGRLGQNRVILLSGSTGIGKSSILGKCTKVLRQNSSYAVFFHSISCTISSQYQTSILDRLYEFLLPNSSSKLDSSFKLKEVMNILQNGSERNDGKFLVIILDGIDELCTTEYKRNWFQFKTHHNILLVLSCAVNKDENNVLYNHLISNTDIFDEIEAKPLKTDQLISIAKRYLLNFGKVLDDDQLNALLTHEMSHNPLWLTTACEELRIYHDFSTLLQFIHTLPSNLIELNNRIINRLLTQDEAGNLRIFLFLLTNSRAGLWESMARQLLGALKTPGHTPAKLVCQQDWMELLRKMKPFLQVQCKPLPIIKFRHKIIKFSVLNILNTDVKTQLKYHSILADVYEPQIDEGLYLYDFVYHIFKSNQIERLTKFFRSKLSWKIYKNHFMRQEIIKKLRCPGNISQNKQITKGVMMCHTCSNKRGNFSIYCRNIDACYLCGNFMGLNFQTDDSCLVYKCPQHSMKPNSCIICDSILMGNQGVNVKLCKMCKINQVSMKTCGELIKECNLNNRLINTTLQKLIEFI